MAAACARTRVAIAILSGVVHITPAKVLLSLSLVCVVALLTEKESTGVTLGDRPGEPRFQIRIPRPPLHLGPRLGLGRWRRGSG